MTSVLRCCAPESKTMLHVNYVSIKLRERKTGDHIEKAMIPKERQRSFHVTRKDILRSIDIITLGIQGF